MSRVGKAPIAIPDKAKVAVDGDKVKVTGPKGEMLLSVHPDMAVGIENNLVLVKRHGDTKRERALHGLTRALINNMVIGVTKGFRRELEIIGVGYRSELKGKQLVLHLGYSHPIEFDPPEGIKIEVDGKGTRLAIEGVNKELVGLVAAKIRSFRSPEPYKGKGVRYAGEHVRTKAGKAAG